MSFNLKDIVKRGTPKTSKGKENMAFGVLGVLAALLADDGNTTDEQGNTVTPYEAYMKARKENDLAEKQMEILRKQRDKAKELFESLEKPEGED